ncbi:MAG TPA: efflux RND transporter periplasmic adaptor subunit [Candidatus Binataceae bacterium]|nr:efflux RND transporter periplasmic adaptor subunit [Candidatus Binataceae bacterium]
MSNGSKARLRNTLLIALAIFLVGGAAIAALNNQLPSFGLFNWGSNRERVILSGNIEAHESVLSFKTVQSRIIELPFDEGQWVRKGDLIARLDDSDYQQNVKTARATLDQSKQQLDAAQANVEALKKTVVADEADLKEKSLDYKRVQHMFDNGATSAQSRDLGETAFKQSQAAWLRDQALQVAAEKNVGSAAAAVRSATENLKLSEIILGYTVLRAPFDGVILTRQAEIGEVMLPSAPVVTLADLDHVWLRAYVNETDIGKVKFGQLATITTDTYPNKKYQGRISAIASRAEFTPKSVETHSERVTLVYRIKIDVFNPAHELVPGMPADADIDLTPSNGNG